MVSCCRHAILCLESHPFDRLLQVQDCRLDHDDRHHPQRHCNLDDTRLDQRPPRLFPRKTSVFCRVLPTSLLSISTLHHRHGRSLHPHSHQGTRNENWTSIHHQTKVASSPWIHPLWISLLLHHLWDLRIRELGDMGKQLLSRSHSHSMGSLFGLLLSHFLSWLWRNLETNPECERL